MSGKRRAPGLEPFTAKELGAWLTDAHGARICQQNGSHIRVRLGSGTDVPLPLKGFVPRILAKEVATRVGVSYHELRAAVGHPITNGRRGRTITQRRPELHHATKDQVVDLLDETRRRLLDLDKWVRGGHHDPALYDRLYEALNRVAQDIPQRDGRLARSAP